MRYPLLACVLVACGKGAAPAAKEPPPVASSRDAAVATTPAAPDAAPPAPPAPKPPDGEFATLADALAAIIPADARVVGFGELHARVDRAAVRSSLSLFTEALPSFGDKVSDLIVETFIVDPKCGQTAVATTKKMETDVKRPEATKSEIALLADAAKAAKIQPHAMTLSCADYKVLMPKGEIDPLAMLTITTRELQRIALSAVAHRDKEPAHRPWVTLYGGALHNDLVPDKALAEWSYAGAVDKATGGQFVEIDLIVPELAAGDAASKKQPWFPAVEKAGAWIQIWKRNAHSFVVILPKTK
ncbi:MAG: hypothetical protein IPQ07_05930 [Myxococcales bacterium]|nr:hypothetical protein [Myxococcales bacterium]